MTAIDPESVHPTTDALFDYVEARLSDAQEGAIEEHLGRCLGCVEIARDVFAFHQVWVSWNVRWQSEMHLRALLLRAVEEAEAQATNPAWRARLDRWRGQWNGMAEAAVRVMSGVVHGTARAVVEGIDALGRPGSRWQFVPALQTSPVRGAASAGTPIVTTSVTEGTRVRVAVRGGDAGEVVIRFDNGEARGTFPLVLLIGMQPAAAPVVRVAEAEQPTGVSYFVARFEGLAPGEYVIAFEPLALPPAQHP